MKRTYRRKNGRSSLKYRRRMEKYLAFGIALLAVLLALLIVAAVIRNVRAFGGGNYSEVNAKQIDVLKPEIDVRLLTVNDYSRPGVETDKITGVVVHYTANPGSTAMENRNYFEGLKDSRETKASSNFIVGLDGEIIQCVPTWEVAYASNERNIDTVSIECCHPDSSGEFTDATYEATVQLCAWLCLKFGLSEEDVIRHYDVTGKNCPKYFVENEEAFFRFREDIKKVMESAGL